MSSRPFEYLICIDLEATCWGDNPLSTSLEKKGEIIEIGAVLLNRRGGGIESEFHDYVRPTSNPILSEYCMKLTGINQTLIERQQPFPVVYQKFNNWLLGLRAAKELKFATPNKRSGSEGNITFCSWTNWDLGKYFEWECRYHGIPRPDYLRAWIDARKIFERYHPKCKFEEALAHLNIVRIGNAHSAINDAKMLAKLMQRLEWPHQVTTYHFHP